MKAIIISVALVVALTTFAALGAGNPDAAKGIVVQYCTACHEVPGYASTRDRAEVGASGFETIANDPDRFPPERLAASLRQPHWPMRQLQLSASDIENLLTFIATLHKP